MERLQDRRNDTGSTPGEGSTPCYAPAGEGSTPRDTTRVGSTSHYKVGAAMARKRDGSKPRTSSEASIAHTTIVASAPNRTFPNDIPGRGRHTDARAPDENIAGTDISHHNNASPRDLFPPTRPALTDRDLATAARQSRLRREAADAEMNTSATELVRERFSKPELRREMADGNEEVSNATRQSVARNAHRLREANANDASILGESQPTKSRALTGEPFLPTDPRAFFPEPLLGPDDSCDPPAWFLIAVREICNTKTTTP